MNTGCSMKPARLLALAQRLQTFASPVPQPARWVRIHPHIIFVRVSIHTAELIPITDQVQVQVEVQDQDQLQDQHEKLDRASLRKRAARLFSVAANPR